MRDSIANPLTENGTVEIVGDMSISRDVLEQHYDDRIKEVNLEQRRACLDEI
jgi:hypothetical protein